jgi:potassium efflux system protein
MPKSLALIAFLGILALLRVEGQTAAPAPAPSTNAAPATNAPGVAAPGAILLSDVVTRALSDSATLQEIQSTLASDQTAPLADQSLPAVTKSIDQEQTSDSQLLETNPTLPALRSAQASWEDLADTMKVAREKLTDRVAELDKQVTSLDQMNTSWQAALALATSSAAPPDILSRIHAVIADIAQTKKSAEAVRGAILSSQNRLAEQDSRISSGIAVIKKAQASAVTLLFTRDSAPIWQLGLASAPSTNPKRTGQFQLASQIQDLRAYLAQKYPTVFIQFLIFFAIAIGLFRARQKIPTHADDDPAIRQAAQVFQVPTATAAVIALLLSGRLYPLAPNLFLAGLGAAALIPAVIILRRLIEPALFPILYAMVIAYCVDQLRYVATDPLIRRILFLLELIAAGAFLFWLLRSQRLAPERTPQNLLARIIRTYARVALGVIGLALLANFLGYSHLSYLIGTGMLKSSYLAVILYAAVRVGDGLLLTLLKLWPLSLLRMVQGHYTLLAKNASLTFRALAFFLWLWEALELFSLRSPLWTKSEAILGATVKFGNIPLSLGPLLRFGITIWATFLISRFLRFVLAEEVYPNLKLGRGVPYAASTMVHYVVLVLGFFFALAALGIDLSQYTVLAGALGVGLGFGLQNIMNNFVSGIILLFERPIKVGDIIQVDTAVGTVQSIGIRASVIRITNGSEIIMPNGNLISNAVTNWTFSNRQRVVEIPFTVGPKSDPQRVMKLFVETAKANPAVLKDPPPQVLLTNATGAALSFELHAWTNSEDWTETRSSLVLSLTTALEHENIPII